jgi:hypothetical protein
MAATVFRSYKAGTLPVVYEFIYSLCIEYAKGRYNHPSEIFPCIERRQLSQELRDAGSMRLSARLALLNGLPVTLAWDAGTIRWVHWVLGLVCCPYLNIQPIPIYLKSVDNRVQSYSQAGAETIMVLRPFNVKPVWFSSDSHKSELVAFSNNRPGNYKAYLPKELKEEGV